MIGEVIEILFWCAVTVNEDAVELCLFSEEGDEFGGK